MRTRRSTPPLAKVSPSGANATDQTPWEWPRNVRISRASVFQCWRQSACGGAGPGPAELGEVVGAVGVVVTGSAIVCFASDEADSYPASEPARLQNRNRAQYNFSVRSFVIVRDAQPSSQAGFRCGVRRSVRWILESSTPRLSE